MTLRFLDGSRHTINIVRTSSEIDGLVAKARVFWLQKSLAGKHTDVFGSDKGDRLTASCGEEHADDHKSGDTGSGGEVVLFHQPLTHAEHLNTYHKGDRSENSVCKSGGSQILFDLNRQGGWIWSRALTWYLDRKWGTVVAVSAAETLVKTMCLTPTSFATSMNVLP